MTEGEINKKIVLRFNRELIEKGNLAAVTELVSDDFINHTAAGSTAKSIEGLRGYIQLLHAAFSEFKVEVHQQVAEDDIVASRKTIYAVHTGSIMGHAATGKKVAFKVMDFVRLRNGKYVEHWGQNNIQEVIAGL